VTIFQLNMGRCEPVTLIRNFCLGSLSLRTRFIVRVDEWEAFNVGSVKEQAIAFNSEHLYSFFLYSCVVSQQLKKGDIFILDLSRFYTEVSSLNAKLRGQQGCLCV
jgi:hypothetical protein